jgi:sensor histidine kinase YesM
VSANILFKYKLYHIPFWLAYFALLFSSLVLKLAFYIPIELCAVYFNLYFLIPKYLEKGRFANYFFGLTTTLMVASGCIVSGYYLTAFFAHSTVYQLYGPGLCTYYFFGNAVPAVFASLTLTTCIKLTKAWIQTKRRQQILEKEQLEAELTFLRHQFNPHFLFNTINSIFFLIHKKPAVASDSLARFSQLLRYQLYECNDQQIPLSKEINYLKNSIELEKLRQNENVKISLRENVSASDALGIAPFILMTFVENAFKHVSGEPDTPNWITIQVDLDHNQLHFSVANSIARNSLGEVMHYSGIGLKNVQRRLDLLYSGVYDLNIQSNSSTFSIQLRLSLSFLPLAAGPKPQNENFSYLTA